MLAEKYRPTTQKELFHKDKIRCIQKWIKNIKDDYDNWKISKQKGQKQSHKPNFKKILLIHGPISCGKTTLVDILFKGFNRIDINSEDIKVNERVEEIILGIGSFDSVSLESMCKGTNTNQKFNIVFIDNIELSDKHIRSFIESVKTNIPIVLVSSNTINVKNLFQKDMPITFIEINKISLMEFSQLISTINKQEQLGLDDSNIKIIIEKSLFDIRQIFHALEQIKSRQNTDYFKQDFDILTYIEEKDIDTDLNDKLDNIFSIDTPFNYSKFSLIASCDPQLISNSIYQNYIEVCDLNYVTKIIDDIKLSDIVYKNIYSDQNWELFDIYSEISCVIPSYNIKKYYKENDKQNNIIKDSSNTKTDNTIIELKPFKDISYNYVNSFNELKELTSKNIMNEIITSKYNILKNVDDITIIFKNIILMITKLNEYFDKNKKGKNTSKKEKFDLYVLLSSDPNGKTYMFILENLVNIIYSYRMFECDAFIEELRDLSFPLNSTQRDTFIEKNIEKLDLRIIKRYINFTSIYLNTIKLIKTHTEMSIKLKLFEILLIEMENNYLEKIKNIKNNNNNIEELSVSLSDLWKL